MESKPRATVVLLCYERPKSFVRALRSVLDQDETVEIIVVDNSKHGAPVDEAKRRGAPLLVVRPSRNLHCKSRFLAAAYASADVVFVMDDDRELASPTSLAHYLAFFDDFPEETSCVLGWEYFNRLGSKDSPTWAAVDFVRGNFMAFRREYLDRVPIGFRDMVGKDGRTLPAGWGCYGVPESAIGVDDLAFQLYADRVLVPGNLDEQPVEPQPSASHGLNTKPGHRETRESFINQAWRVIKRKGSLG